MPTLRTFSKIILALFVVAAAGYAVLGVLATRRAEQQAARLARVGAEVMKVHVTAPACDADKECSCAIPSSETFTRCRVIDGRIALSVASNDECFTQWMAVNRTWRTVPHPMYLGRYWVSHLPREIAPGWSLLAIAPCVD